MHAYSHQGRETSSLDIRETASCGAHITKTSKQHHPTSKSSRCETTDYKVYTVRVLHESSTIFQVLIVPTPDTGVHLHASGYPPSNHAEFGIKIGTPSG